jgi:phosphatidylglycerophosphate synthase
MTADVAFLEVGPAGGHRMVLGGRTALERAVRDQAKRGATRVIVAAAPETVRPGLPVEVEFVAPGTTPPPGATRARADVVAGIEVVDEASRRKAEWALLRGMNKSFEGPVDALINWRFSMRITRVLARTPVTPNLITIVAIGIGVGAAFLASRGSWVPLAIAGVLLELNSILDSCDGELARLRWQYSKLGQWLDNLGDDIVDNLFIAACGYGLGGIWFPIAAAAGAARVLVSATQLTQTYLRTGTGDAFAFRWWFESAGASADEVYSPTSPMTWLRSFGRRDTFVFVWMIACLAGFAPWVVVHGAVIAAINLSLLFLHFVVFRR